MTISNLIVLSLIVVSCLAFLAFTAACIWRPLCWWEREIRRYFYKKTP